MEHVDFIKEIKVYKGKSRQLLSWAVQLGLIHHFNKGTDKHDFFIQNDEGVSIEDIIDSKISRITINIKKKDITPNSSGYGKAGYQLLPNTQATVIISGETPDVGGYYTKNYTVVFGLINPLFIFSLLIPYSGNTSIESYKKQIDDGEHFCFTFTPETNDFAYKEGALFGSVFGTNVNGLKVNGKSEYPLLVDLITDEGKSVLINPKEIVSIEEETPNGDKFNSLVNSVLSTIHFSNGKKYNFNCTKNDLIEILSSGL